MCVQHLVQMDAVGEVRVGEDARDHRAKGRIEGFKARKRWEPFGKNRKHGD